MLFELERDPAVKIAAFKSLIKKTLGKETSVKVLSQESVIECRDLNEITTEKELRSGLEAQCNLGTHDYPALEAIRMKITQISLKHCEIALQLS